MPIPLPSRRTSGPLESNEPRPPALAGIVAALLVTVVAGVGCHQTKLSSGDERGSSGESSPPVSPRASASASAPGSGPRCTADADCRTWSSYCKDSPCTCQVVGKTEPDPRCASGDVECFADPCMKKAAACQNGRCELVMADPK